MWGTNHTRDPFILPLRGLRPLEKSESGWTSQVQKRPLVLDPHQLRSPAHGHSAFSYMRRSLKQTSCAQSKYRCKSTKQTLKTRAAKEPDWQQKKPATTHQEVMQRRRPTQLQENGNSSMPKLMSVGRSSLVQLSGRGVAKLIPRRGSGEGIGRVTES